MKKYVIKGEAIAKGRPRFTKRGHIYTPATTKKYETKVKASLIEQGAEPTLKACRVNINVYKGYLKSWTKKQLEQAKSQDLHAKKKPDVDNYAKAILDGANGLLFKDDAQIVELTIRKQYGEVSRAEIELEEVE